MKNADFGAVTLRSLGRLSIALSALPLFAQSDPTLFDTVLNVPPDSAPLTIVSDTQLNVLDGGELTATAYSFGSSDGTGENVEVNVIDGAIRGAAVVNAGARLFVGPGAEVGRVSVVSGGRVSIEGGTLLGALQAFDGSEVTISMGDFVGEFVARPGSRIEFIGNEFRVNGELVEDSIVSLEDAFYFSWTAEDGEGYALRRDDLSLDLRIGEVTLTRVDVPPTDPTPQVIDFPLDAQPDLHAGEVLELREGGSLPHGVVALPGTTYEIVGGLVGSGFQASRGSTVRIRGGSLERGFNAEDGAVEIFGGEYYLNGRPFDGGSISSEIINGDATGVFTGVLEGGGYVRFRIGDVLGQTVLTSVGLPEPSSTPIIVDTPASETPGALRPGETLILRDGGALPPGFFAVASDVQVQGGSGSLELINSGLTITGGSQEVSVKATHDSTVRLQGGNARVELTSGSEAAIEAGVVSALVVDSGAHATVNGGALANVLLSANRDKRASLLIRGGETRVANVGGRSFRDGLGEELTIEGGRVEFLTIGRASRLNLLGGEVGQVSAGEFVFRSSPIPAQVNLLGGTLDRVVALSGSVIEIIGAFPAELDSGSDATINIRGGLREGGLGFESLRASSGSEFNLFGSDFLLDGKPIDGLLRGEAVVMAPADGLLTATLADGSVFQVPLSTEPFVFDGLGAEVRLTITLVPEPTSLMLLALGAIVVGFRCQSTCRVRSYR